MPELPTILSATFVASVAVGCGGAGQRDKVADDSQPVEDDPGDGSAGGTGDLSEDSASDTAVDVDHCVEVAAFGPEYDAQLALWTAQDEAAAWPTGGLVAVGSSSIRRWEDMSWRYTDHTLIQRGFGGAQLAEVALRADALVLRHAPAGVVVFAGTNDVAHGVPPEVVGERVRCLHQRLRDVRPDLPVLFIGITPTPARWESWAASAEVNAVAEAVAAEDALFAYVDVPTAFLATGSPPDDSLFVADRLHLSEAGYALWDSVLRPEVDALLPATAVTPTVPPGPGDRLLVDFGANDGENGEATAIPDHLGQHWNNWHPLAGGAEVFPGERLAGLITDTGAVTSAEVVVTGGFFNNGRLHGGLLWPSSDRLGSLAVGTATQDFFYAVDDDKTGGLALRGLDPALPVNLRIFASRDDPETRSTTYTLHGLETASQTLQTSGTGAGSGNGNDDTVVVFDGVLPDAHGRLHLDLSIAAGSYAYISLLELSVPVGAGTP